MITRRVDFIAVHCADSPNGQPHTIGEVDSWHRDRGFKRSAEWRRKFNEVLTSVGYHFVVTIDGVVWTGRHPDEVGAHVQGFNSRSIGICMIGKNCFTQAQWDSLYDLHANLSVTYPHAQWLGHRDFSPDKNGDGVISPAEYMKLCPGFSVQAWLKRGCEPEERHVLA